MAQWVYERLPKKSYITYINTWIQNSKKYTFLVLLVQVKSIKYNFFHFLFEKKRLRTFSVLVGEFFNFLGFSFVFLNFLENYRKIKKIPKSIKNTRKFWINLETLKIRQIRAFCKNQKMFRIFQKITTNNFFQSLLGYMFVNRFLYNFASSGKLYRHEFTRIYTQFFPKGDPSHFAKYALFKLINKH